MNQNNHLILLIIKSHQIHLFQQTALNYNQNKDFYLQQLVNTTVSIDLPVLEVVKLFVRVERQVSEIVNRLLIVMMILMGLLKKRNW
jgi:hypothetical protein